MALADPQTVVIDGTTFTLPRISTEKGRTSYVSSDGNTRLLVLQSNGARKRTAVRIEKTKVAADPLTAINAYATDAVYVMFDRPNLGFSNDELVKQFTALAAALQASTNSLLFKVLGGES